MTVPRRFLAGTTYLVSRRCAERRFFLTPTAEVVAITRYCLALVASESSVLVHQFIFSTNHLHLVLTDPEGGALPAFLRRFHSLLARALNAQLNRSEAFWSPGSYSMVELHGPETVMQKLVYVIVNAVKDGLVARPEDFPGFHSDASDVGRKLRAERPESFFRQRGPRALPEVVSFELVAPPQFDDMPLEEFRVLLAKRVEAAVQEVRKDRARRGLRKCVGRRKIMRRTPTDRPSTKDDHDQSARNRELFIACHDVSHRTELLAQLKQWRAEYRAAWAAYKSGDTSARFPLGTYQMRVGFHAHVRAQPPPLRAA